MMRYYMHDGPSAFRFELAGDLDAEDAARLAQDWHTASSVVGDVTLIIDLSFVTSIDEAARDLFRRWHATGAQFAASTKRSRELVESITERPFTRELPHPPTYRPWYSVRSLSQVIPLLAMLFLLPPSQAWAADDGASMAFARFAARSSAVASTDTGDIAIEIDASLPQTGKQGHFEAIRHRGPAGAPEYRLIGSDGDATVKRQVIARYLAAEQQAYARPAASLALTPENYKFRYEGSIEGGGTRVYIFAIKPRHRGDGLIEGQIWIDAATGAVVHQDGRLSKPASVFIRGIGMARDTAPRVDSPYLRITHIDIQTRFFGRAELTIRERPATSIANAETCQ
jgi:hypothetical protein